MWRSREEITKLEADTKKAVKNIALSLILGSLALNLIAWLFASAMKYEGRSILEMFNLKPLPVIAIGMGLAVVYTMWMVKDYRKAMDLFKRSPDEGSPDEEVCAEEKKKARKRIGWCGILSVLGWILGCIAGWN